MARTDVHLNLEASLVARAEAEGAELSVLVETALRRYLDRAEETKAADQRWAEDNALIVEAIAGGAEEARPVSR